MRDRLELSALENVSDLDKILYNGYNSLIAFGKVFLAGDYGRCENSEAHYVMDKELHLETTVPAVFIIAREHAKTTIVKALIVRDFCYTKENMVKFANMTKCKELKIYWAEEVGKRMPLFYGWCSDRQKKSMANVQYIKDALTKNANIIKVFGNLSGKPKGYQWTTEDIITWSNDKLVSRSNLTSIRGETHSDPVHGTIRYIRVFCDDFENEENTKSVKKRAYVVNVLMNAIWGAIDKDVGRLIINETPIHYASLAQQFIEMKAKEAIYPELSKTNWHIYVYPATQPSMEGGVLWHGHYPRPKLERIKQQYIAGPKGISGYMQEYELQVQASELATWTDKHIKYWKGKFTMDYGFPALIINKEVVPVNVFGGSDPATDIETADSDFSVILAVAMDNLGNYYVLNYIRDKGLKEIGLRDDKHNLVTDPGVSDYIMDFYDSYRMESFTIEDVGMTRGIFNSLDALMLQRQNFNYSWLTAEPGGRKKLNRIKATLNHKFATGKIYLLEGMHDLRHEITTFGPTMAHDDIIESLAISIMNAYAPDHARMSTVQAKARYDYAPTARQRVGAGGFHQYQYSSNQDIDWQV